MTSGKIMAVGLLLAAVIAGFAAWYLNLYAYYYEVDELTGAQAIVVTLPDGSTRPVPVRDFQGIDATSAPHRYRACFTVDPADFADAAPYADPTPLNGPPWFECYSSKVLSEDIAAGKTRVYLGQSEVRPDVDRVLAVYPDGRAYAWHQINDKSPERGVMD